jgi:hypothetical protein
MSWVLSPCSAKGHIVIGCPPFRIDIWSFAVIQEAGGPESDSKRLNTGMQRNAGIRLEHTNQAEEARSIDVPGQAVSGAD